MVFEVKRISGQAVAARAWSRANSASAEHFLWLSLTSRHTTLEASITSFSLKAVRSSSAKHRSPVKFSKNSKCFLPRIKQVFETSIASVESAEGEMV
jgi:hypothetical protein